MSQLNIQTEFNELGALAQQLDETGNYDVDMMLSGLHHMLAQNNYFYGTFAKNFPDKDSCKVFYDLPVNPVPHQLVYVQLSCGYPKEIRGPHWCYVLTSYGQKLTVIPAASIKENSGPVRAPYQFDIDEGNGTKGRIYGNVTDRRPDHGIHQAGAFLMPHLCGSCFCYC